MSDSSKDEPLQATGTSSMARLAVEKERLKQGTYMSLYKDLLRKSRGLLQLQREEDHADFAEEAALLKDAIASQRKLWIAGICVGALSFATLRYLPHYVIRHFGGQEKVKALEEAERQAKLNGTAWARNVTAILVEGSFSFWAGYRAYHLAAEHSEDTYGLIAELPLCAGRSAISEGLCDEWIDITHKQIPSEFWKNLSNPGSLRDEKAWRAIGKFSENCIRRQRYEAQLRDARGISNQEQPISLPGKVPKYSAPFTNELSKQEAEQLVTDRN